MMRYILTVRDLEVVKRLETLGGRVKTFKNLKSIVEIDCDFDPSKIDGVCSVENADSPKQSPIDQSVQVDSTFLNGCWALPRMCRRRAPWDVYHISHPVDTFYRYQLDGTGVDIYFCDSGIDLDHPEFGGRATNVYEYHSSGGAGDNNGHGTLTAGAAGGSTVGTAKGALLWSFKSADSAGANTDASIIDCIDEILTHYAGRSGTNRPAVCSLSINPVHGSGVAAAIGSLIDAGIVCVFSVGNDKTSVNSSAIVSEPDIIAVGGIGFCDLPYWVNSDGTNYGTEVDILAPAQSIRVASATVRAAGDYEVRRGTSIACPFVSGVVACMLQGRSRLTTRTEVQQVREYVLAQASAGYFRAGFGLSPLPDKILYIDPSLSEHEMTGS